MRAQSFYDRNFKAFLIAHTMIVVGLLGGSLRMLE
jgi:hypothetical protein